MSATVLLKLPTQILEAVREHDVDVWMCGRSISWISLFSDISRGLSYFWFLSLTLPFLLGNLIGTRR